MKDGANVNIRLPAREIAALDELAVRRRRKLGVNCSRGGLVREAVAAFLESQGMRSKPKADKADAAAE